MTTATFTDCDGAYEMRAASFKRRGVTIYSWVSIEANKCVVTGLVNQFRTEARAVLVAKLHRGFSNITQ